MAVKPTLVAKARYQPSLDVIWSRADRIRQLLIVLLGLVWLLDAALQFQPFMFTRSFATQIIEPAAAGEPNFVAGPLLWSAHLMLHHIAFSNAVFATTQLLIAIGLFLPRTRKLALAGSIVYALSVWWLGEGLGGILTGASPLAGVPGGVVLYALIALLLWPGKARNHGDLIVPATMGRFGATGTGLTWAVLWGSFAYYLLLPANRGAEALARIFRASASGEPGWLQALENAAANVLGSHGTLVSVLLAGACAFAALGIFKPPLVKAAVVVAAALALVIWVAEAFGGIFTGRGTDPNTGLLLVLLAACYWPYRAGVARRPRATGVAARTGLDTVRLPAATGLDLRERPARDRQLVPAGQGPSTQSPGRGRTAVEGTPPPRNARTGAHSEVW